MIQFLKVVMLFVIIKADRVPFITKCKSDDDNCLKASTTAAIPRFGAGIPEFNMSALDPMFFKRIDSSTPVLNFLIDNATVKGFGKCIAEKAHRDIKKSKIFLTMTCDGGKMDAEYMLSGQILFVAIEGHGKMHVDLNDGLVVLEFDINNVKGEDGKNHWNIKHWTYTYDLRGRSNLYFENLFKKDSLLGQTAQEMVAANGNAVIKEIGTGVVLALLNHIVKQVQQFFHAVPSEDLALD